MGPTSTKFDPEMEDKDGQNPFQTAEIFAAADARDRAENQRHQCRERSADPPKKPTPPIRALFISTANGSTIGAPETKAKEAFGWRRRRESNKRQIAKNNT